MLAKPPHDQETLHAYKERRRRERWSAFFTPLLTLTSIVVSIGITMSLLKACQERFPNSPFNKTFESPPPNGVSPPTR
jgi:hypothetical protein